MELDSVSGTISGEEGAGLGPTFNGTGCAQCHAQPAVGGSSPMINPQVALANLDGAKNTVPSFITSDGPVREARGRPLRWGLRFRAGRGGSSVAPVT